MAMATDTANEKTLIEAFSIIENTPEIEVAIAKLRDFLNIDHIVYHTSKFGASPSADQYIRLTYPASWIKRYLQMSYADVDPVVREGFMRSSPFSWNELTIASAAEASFFADALAHGIGPHGYSIPVVNKQGHRGLFSVSFSRSEGEWNRFLTTHRSTLIQIANRLHRRVVAEVFFDDRPYLTTREIECLRWV